ncbi:MAG: DUF1592 domain-containing protein [Gammaproteobacteria bacterium]|nr:DUF1592 domain-containing protein [Gammaproteobacteria bacterium]
MRKFKSMTTRPSTSAALAGVASALTLLPALCQAAHPDGMNAQWQLLEDYCVTCHNFTDWAGEIAFDAMSPDNIPADAEVWEKVVRKLNGGLMPPPGEKRPGHQQMASFVGQLETTLDSAAEHSPNPGYVDLHRLNRKEYSNAVRDLLGVEIDAEALLPQDNSQNGFDNIAAVLTVTPTFMEQYVAAAREVALTAVGDGAARAAAATYVYQGGESNRRHVEGLPLGTRGGMVARHYFPADGEYAINIPPMAQALWVYNMEFENHVVVTLDGAPIYQTTIGGELDQKAIDQVGIGAADHINERLKDIRFHATAGPHDVGATFLARTFAESDRRLQSKVPGGGMDTILQIPSFEIRGPYVTAGVSDSVTREKIFICEPAAEAEARSCAQKILGRLARLAYRRPLETGDTDALMAFYDHASATGGFDAGIRQGLTAILASPDFLFRYIVPPAAVAAGEIYTLNDIELASRLSFFLWSSVPDETLLDLAEQGVLHEPRVLEAQVKRMLADRRARALVTGFAFQWLDMDGLEQVIPDPELFPHAATNGDPRDAYRQELALFIESIIREDRAVPDLLTADYTYLNERAALLYGMSDIRGDQFRRVKLTDPARFGLLGKGAVLMATSYPNRTTPVLRGKFILENLLGAPPAPPPPGVDSDLVEVAEGEAPKTVRERLAMHRTDPSCNGCHGAIDPLGLALENFNVVGQWRNTDIFSDGRPIDATGELPDGTSLDGPNDLREALVSRTDQFVQNFTEQLMMFALGRTLSYRDMPVVRGIVRDSRKRDFRLSSIVLGIAGSDAFGKLQVPAAEDAAPTQQSMAAAQAALD